MRQFILPQSYDGAGDLVLNAKESRYLTRVLRLGVGDEIIARDRDGKTRMMAITASEAGICTLSASESGVNTDTLPAYRGPSANLVLMQCLLKGRKEDDVVRQATEIGVTSIVLVQSRHCVPDAKERGTGRIDRLKAKVREALQQSGSAIPTQLEERIIPLLELPAWWAGRGKVLFFHQSEQDQQQSLSAIAGDIDIDEPVGVLIGPEGGFSDEECRFLSQNGFIPVLLKTNVLRSETAAIYALSALQVLLNDRN
ncbi:MAG TPA: RsmE family RNA methyltransferase [Sphaerochaeta sp.]|nr:RsmE family RNA methyltransferase [Spirochaetota bacterium]NLV61429.1 16S rRNA (uracil(1498)-N(3))-methyltransferase [Spirochaetales bacterium]HOE84279.1 RsmE family RNA methyltransferase [Sphaerochaeta sp.]HOQ94341.1 RsmE family RNA methyltransferase [Sphaerochaeta sp.]HPK47011.1 RsmE family RNA methyltransferase [Sphaerochaeta sp.]